MVEILKVVSAILSLGFWTASFILWYHYAFTRPAVRQPGAGRVYPLDTHGTVVYLTSHEHFLLYSLMVVGVVCFFLTAGFYAVGRRLDRQVPKDGGLTQNI